MKSFIFRILKIIFSIFYTANALRTCTIITPEFIHSGRNFSISLAVHNLNTTSEFEVTIESDKFKDFNVVQLQPNGVQIVEFSLPSLNKDEYVLRIEGENGIYAKISTILKFATYQPIFAIQIDKNSYRNGETLFYRILCMNENLRPMKPENAVDLRIMATDQRIVFIARDIKFKNSVSKGEIYLNRASFENAELVRFAVFMNGELQAEVNFTINNDDDDENELEHEVEENKLKCDTQGIRSMINATITTLGEKNNDEVVFNIELEKEKQGKILQQTELTTFRITSNKIFKYFIYTIIGRGRILSSERIELDRETNECLLKLRPNNEMAPLSKLIVYFIDEKNNFYYDEAYFNVERKLANTLTLSTPSTPLKPNEKVEFHIKTSPNSYVGLLAFEETVEENADCLKSYNNDLNIEDLLRNYGGKSKLQRGELTGNLILTTAKNLKHKEKRHQKAWLEKFQTKTIAHNTKWRRNWFFAEIENTTSINSILAHNTLNMDSKWRISAFALNEHNGLAYTVLKPNIETKKSYNVTFQLPNSIYAQEVLILPLRIENFLNVTITLKIEFLPEVFDVEHMHFLLNTKMENIHIAPKAIAELKYSLRTKTAGVKKLKFLFFSKAGNDRHIIKLNVKSKGLRHVDELYYLVDLRNVSTFEQLVWPTKPYTDMLGVKSSSAALYANVIEPFMIYTERAKINSENYQTAEQLISLMAISKLTLDHLRKTTVNYTAESEVNKIRDIHLLYLTLLDYKSLKNGGFNYFIYNKPGDESVWLTALILKWLPKLAENFTINETILDEAYAFLALKQNEDGSFRETGLKLNRISGNDSLALTAHVLWAFLEQQTINERYKPLMEKSIEFIMENIPKSENLYAKALSIYVLHKAGLQGVEKVLQKLDRLAISNDNYKFWAEGMDTDLNNVATTALLVLTMNRLNQNADITSTIKWLIEKGNIFKQNELYPTEAIILSYQAVLCMISEGHVMETELDFTIGHQGLFKMDYNEVVLSKDFANKRHHLKFRAQDTSLKLKADGKGLALAVIRYDYSVNFRVENVDIFKITIMHPQRGLPISFEMKICLTYEGIKLAADLTILNVGLLSGYAIKVEQIEMLVEKVDFLKYASLNADNSNLQLLLLGLERDEEKCFTIELHKVHYIAKQVEVPVTCYEFTESTNLAINFYNIETSICDLCSGEIECTKECN